MGVFTDRLAADMKARPKNRAVYLSNFCRGDGSNEATGLQAAFDAAATTGYPLMADVAGKIGVGSTVTLGDERANSPQLSILTVMGNLRVKATASMDALLRISGTITGTGNIEADGANLAFFPIYLKNYGRCTLGRVQAYGGLVSGVAGEPSGNNNSWTVEKLRVHGNGTKHVTTATVAARSAEAGWASTGDSAPYTTWTLSTPLPAHLTSREWAVPAVIFADKRVMQVRRVVNATTIEVFNENRPVGTTDTLSLASAAVAFPYYGDVGIWSIGNADVRDNPNAWALNYGGYGGHVGVWAQQNNWAGVAVLKWAIGLTFAHFYTEMSGTTGAGTPWLVARESIQTTLFIGPGTNAEPDNFQVMDKDWMSLSKRSTHPAQWTMHRKDRPPVVAGGSGPLSNPITPVDGPEHNPGTRNLTPGTLQMYSRSSGAYNLRIANAANPGGVGMVTLTAATTGGGTAVNLSLLNSNGDTIQGASTHSLTIWGTVTLTYGRVGNDWKIALTGTNEATA